MYLQIFSLVHLLSVFIKCILCASCGLLCECCVSALNLNKQIRETDTRLRQREDNTVCDCCDGVFCVGDRPLGIPRGEVFIPCSTNTASAPHGESTSQLVPGFKKRSLPLPHRSSWSSHTYTGMHASYTYAQRHIGEWVGLFLLHTLSRPQCPASVYSWRPPCWYHLILSQLHQPTPYPPRQELFSSLLYSCTCTLSVSSPFFSQHLRLHNNRRPFQMNKLKK